VQIISERCAEAVVDGVPKQVPSKVEPPNLRKALQEDRNGEGGVEKLQHHEVEKYARP
jgi:hypothetical protein